MGKTDVLEDLNILKDKMLETFEVLMGCENFSEKQEDRLGEAFSLLEESLTILLDVSDKAVWNENNATRSGLGNEATEFGNEIVGSEAAETTEKGQSDPKEASLALAPESVLTGVQGTEPEIITPPCGKNRKSVCVDPGTQEGQEITNWALHDASGTDGLPNITLTALKGDAFHKDPSRQTSAEECLNPEAGELKNVSGPHNWKRPFEGGRFESEASSPVKRKRGRPRKETGSSVSTSPAAYAKLETVYPSGDRPDLPVAKAEVLNPTESAESSSCTRGRGRSRKVRLDTENSGESFERTASKLSTERKGVFSV